MTTLQLPFHSDHRPRALFLRVEIIVFLYRFPQSEVHRHAHSTVLRTVVWNSTDYEMSPDPTPTEWWVAKRVEWLTTPGWTVASDAPTYCIWSDRFLFPIGIRPWRLGCMFPKLIFISGSSSCKIMVPRDWEVALWKPTTKAGCWSLE